MTQQNETAKPKSIWAKLGRILFWSVASLVALVFVANLIWKYSGSNQWRLVGERNGVKVYALKAPGDTLEQVRGVTHFRTTLAGMTLLGQDPHTCDRFGCTDSKILGQDNEQLLYSTFRFPSPFPFKPREFVIAGNFFQNSKTKELVIEYNARPELLPPNDCCVRVTRMNNTFFVKPLGNGWVEMDYRQNMDLGGFLPGFLFNELRKEMMFTSVPYMQKVLKKPYYQQAKYNFIQE